MNDRAGSILKSCGADVRTFLPDPVLYGVIVGQVPGHRALETWQALRNAYSETGLWPIIRGQSGEPIDVPEGWNIAAELGRVPAGPIRKVLDGRFREWCEMNAEFIGESDPNDSFESVARRADASGCYTFRGKPLPDEPWPTERSHQDLNLQATKEVSGEYFPEVDVALVALRHPYEAPAYLAFGGWNECPEPSLMVAALREWNMHYGMVPICMAGGVLECVVERPPQTQVDAMALAAEHWLFCEDSVGQGTQSVRQLAIELWRSPYWYFWWD